MGKHIKIKLKNQKKNALKKRAAISFIAELYMDGAELYWAQAYETPRFIVLSPSLLMHAYYTIKKVGVNRSCIQIQSLYNI